MWRVGSRCTLCKTSSSPLSWSASNAKDVSQTSWDASQYTLWSHRPGWRERPPVGWRNPTSTRGSVRPGIAWEEEVCMNVLVVDVGGTHVKVLVSGEREPRKFPSGPTLTAQQMVAGVKKVAGDWKYDAVSIGFPGPVLRNRPVAEPRNLGSGWVGFNFR